MAVSECIGKVKDSCRANPAVRLPEKDAALVQALFGHAGARSRERE